MRTRFGVVLAAMTMLWAATAQGFTVGDPAPKLALGPFIKGQPVTAFEPGKVYVIEFWATWCGPCRASIPHLSELARKYKDVIVIGTNVWEPDVTKAKPFVDQMGDQMAYRVALDDDSKMADTWMKDGGQDGIPAAFIVDGQGKIAWVGHPMSMDEPLAAVVAGTYDLAGARQAAAAEAARKAKMKEITAKMRAAGTDRAKQIAVYREWFASDPDAQKQYGIGLFNLLKLSDPTAATVYYRQLVNDTLRGDAEALNGLAWQVVDPRLRGVDPELAKLALSAAQRADQLADGRNAPIADTLAAAYWRCGDANSAVSCQARALELAAGTELAKEMAKRLAQYEAEAGRPAYSGCSRVARTGVVK
ncbi:MAG: redoxin family protein [Armatimonadetes bacterium]|nr:redoxin family protein [Armatimonadota bacterium]